MNLFRTAVRLRGNDGIGAKDRSLWQIKVLFSQKLNRDARHKLARMNPCVAT